MRSVGFQLALAALVAVAVGLGCQATGALDGTEQRSLQARFQLRGDHRPSDLTVVAIDAKSFADLQQHWPFPRSLHSEAIEALRRAGAREIVYDVQFTEPTAPREDLALYRAIDRAGGAVLATTESDDDGRTAVLGGEENLRRVHARAGAGDFAVSDGGVLDRMPHTVGRLPALATIVAQRAGRPPLDRAQFHGRGAWIDYRGGPETITTVSFSDLLAGRVAASALRGRTVVVGATVPSLQDVHHTPTGSDLMSGPEVQANAIWTALHGLPLRSPPTWLAVLLVVALGAAVPLLRLRARVLYAALAAPAIGLAYAVAAQVAFAHGMVVWVSAPLVALATGTLTTVVVSHLVESAVRRGVSRDNEVLERRVRERTRELRETQLEILQRLATAAEWRHHETGEHIERIGLLSERLALALGMTAGEAELLRNASATHDIGKIGVPDRILLKPGRLDSEEWSEMQRHAEMGAAMLAGSESPLLRLAETIARTHHERWNGSGYPAGLSGEEIPLAGRICAVVDVFDALLSRRPYKRPWTIADTLAELRAERGKHFDPVIVDAFLAIAPAIHAELYESAAAGAPPLAA